jgi:hypothetical protein
MLEAVEALRRKKGKDRTKTQFATKIGRKTSLGPSYFVLLNFHSQFSYVFDALLCRNWPFLAP